MNDSTLHSPVRASTIDRAARGVMWGADVSRLPGGVSMTERE